MSVITIRYGYLFLYSLVVILSTATTDVFAHTLRPSVATIELTQNGILNIQIKTNAEALLVGFGSEHTDTDDSPDAAAYNNLRALSSTQLSEAFEGFAAGLLDAHIVETDIAEIVLVFNRIIVPEPGDLDLSRDSIVELTGSVPQNSRHIVWRWPERYGSSVVRLLTPGSQEPITMWLPAGQTSDFLEITGIAEPRPIATTVGEYIALGFTHILPFGLDHILFLLGLYLLSTKFSVLLWQVSAFTLAHTITLGLSVLGFINFPSDIVEVLIALSIVYIGIENCYSSRLQPWRIILVFVFGLLHGIGFAGVLGDLGLPEGAFLTALISFNIGVEFGQFAIIFLAFLLVGLFRRRTWYRRAVEIPGSLFIACAGLYWSWERALG